MSNVTRRIQKWELLFKKYEEANSLVVYDILNNSWESPQDADRRQDLPKDVKARIDGLWKNDRDKTLGKLQQQKKIDNDLKKTKNISKDCNSHKFDEAEDRTSMEDSTNDEDYYSYESDAEDAENIPISKKEFFVALCETSMSRAHEIQQRRKDLLRSLDSLGTKQTLHENDQQKTLTSPSRQDFVQKSPSTHSTSETSPSTLKCERSLSEKKSLTKSKNLREKSTINELSFSKHLGRLEHDSPSSKQKKEFKFKQALPEKRSSSLSHEKFKSKIDKPRTTLATTPFDRKRKILTSPVENSQQSLMLTMEDCHVNLTRAIIPVKKVLTEDYETCGRVSLPLSILRDEVSLSGSTLSVQAASSVKIGAGEPSLTTPNFSKSLGKTISLDSAVLRKKRNSEMRAYRALTNGRSLFHI